MRTLVLASLMLSGTAKAMVTLHALPDSGSAVVGRIDPSQGIGFVDSHWFKVQSHDGKLTGWARQGELEKALPQGVTEVTTRIDNGRVQQQIKRRSLRSSDLQPIKQMIHETEQEHQRLQQHLHEVFRGIEAMHRDLWKVMDRGGHHHAT